MRRQYSPELKKLSDKQKSNYKHEEIYISFK